MNAGFQLPSHLHTYTRKRMLPDLLPCELIVRIAGEPRNESQMGLFRDIVELAVVPTVTDSRHTFRKPCFALFRVALLAPLQSRNWTNNLARARWTSGACRTDMEEAHMYICMHFCMCVCMYVCLYIHTNVCMYVRM